MFSSFSISHAGSEVRAEARQQLKVVLSISFLPLIVGFIAVVSASTYFSLPAVWQSFSSVFLHGELYFYAMSACAQIFFVSSFIEKRGVREMRLSSGVFVFFCTALMALYIGQGDIRNTTLHGILSVVLLLVAVLINYRVLVISQQPPPMPENVNRNRANAMSDNLDTEYD